MSSFRLRLFVVSSLLAIPAASADFRPPAVPLVTHDPYFSIWSMADHLNDAPTKHWTGAVHSLTSLIRIDGKPFRVMGSDPRGVPKLEQTKVEVWPTSTRYEFAGSGIRLTLTFLTPALPSDLDVLSRPASYLTWIVQSTDSQPHQIEIYFDAGSDISVNTRDQAVVSSRFRINGQDVLRVGTRQQPMLEKSGDDLRIDWGYLYTLSPAAPGSTNVLATRPDALKSFVASGHLPENDDLRSFQPYAQPTPVLAHDFAFSLDGAQDKPASRYLVLAYDDEFSVEYLNRRLRPYWRRKGDGIAELLSWAVRDYPSLEDRCAKFDATLIADLKTVGGDEYARLCSLAYRQAIAAHKLVADTDGTPLFFSKENFSNGSIDTVDVTYPSSPFFLLFNPTLLEAQLRPIMEYASLPRWPFPFAPHDLGRYPLANGQQYGGGEKTEENQMPVEESGNMLLMVGALAEARNGDAAFARKYWGVLTKWAEYLNEKGLDPENQLCTDDFAGHLAHNSNLSIKAILALAAYGKLAGLLGHSQVQKQYLDIAHTYATRWAQLASEQDHYRLAFDRAGTWSQKYNLVWDRLLDLNAFPAGIIQTELTFYKSHANVYGLPLDNRADYTKIDWLAWTASLSSSPSGFQDLFAPAYKFANDTPTRVPLTDWYDTKTGKQTGFQARSVVGGIFIEMLTDKSIWKRYVQMSSR
jgi:hypothetical protein